MFAYGRPYQSYSKALLLFQKGYNLNHNPSTFYLGLKLRLKYDGLID